MPIDGLELRGSATPASSTTALMDSFTGPGDPAGELVCRCALTQAIVSFRINIDVEDDLEAAITHAYLQL